MKRIFIFLCVVVLLVLSGGGYWIYQQKIDPHISKIKNIASILNTPIDAQNIAFSELHPGKNDFNGTVLELFDIGLMKKEKHETFYVEDLEDCSSGCSTVTDYYFSYAGKDIKLSEEDWVSGGTAGRDITYDVSILNKETEKWDTIGGLGSEEGLRVVGYKDYLIISGSYYRYHWARGEAVLPYNLKEMKVVPAKYFMSRVAGNFWAGDLFGERINTFYIKNGKLYLRAPRDQCYFLSDKPTYVCSDNCDLEETFQWNQMPQYMYAGCVARYYPIEATTTPQTQSEIFKDEYAREAAKYDLILRTTNWANLDAGVKPSEDIFLNKEIKALYQGNILSNFQYTASSSLGYNNEGLYKHPAEWLSPLLGRTLNLVLAEDMEGAWEMFREDFEIFSKKYPLINPVDFVRVERDLREMF
ncbi:MAG: hypothetical protein UW27_C0010G0002 [Parcubacteria group bacterium GW2011_GWA1_44_13]|uniref:Uncharacterized protein n=1 Tax=Candidatus Nomurabacteria bacterium GW2011_GWB1_44_12 TaxID=1618748 RepID=A0A837I961_9BACT|nr:MAG: hypothetical protein UW25_C0012G0003 [Candidatus Nomurabacteria bacterium GW2011_GWB1_44_12]KKT37722.1 MAG: hypothetical protein UW27_C0010G0002 [Parcubacteria group bacterium GW2011_GWA1_44_13]HBB44060.1 hypothetical protein [Candidatus Yonathbacteria bacterium]